MTANQAALPPLKAFAIATLCTVAASAALARMIHNNGYDWWMLTVSVGYPMIAATVLGIPALLVARRLRAAPLWSVVPVAVVLYALPAVAVHFSIAPILSEPNAPVILLPQIIAPSAFGSVTYWALRETGDAKKRSRALTTIVAIATFLPPIGWATAWRVSSPDHFMTNAEQQAKSPDWKFKRSDECRIRSNTVSQLRTGVNLRQPARACGWSGADVRLALLAGRSFYTIRSEGDDYLNKWGTIAVGRPNYSLLHLRALIPVTLGSVEGHECEFRLGLAGWNLGTCRMAWIS